MPEYLAPGVYIEEVSGAQPIEGVSTSVTGFVGVTQMGPLDKLGPVLVTSFPEFQRTFGGYFMPGFGTAGFNFLPHAVAGFFNNGGQLLYIKRVTGSSPAPAVSTAANGLENNAGTPAITTRLSSSASGGATSVKLLSLLGIQNATTFTLTQVKNGITTVSAALTVTSYDYPSSTVSFTPALLSTASYDAQYTTVTLTGGTAVTASGAPANAPGVPLAPVPNAANFALQSASPGIWGNTPIDPTATGLRVQIAPSSRAQSQVQSVSNIGGGTNNLVTLNSARNFYAGAILEFDAGGTYSVAGNVTAGTFVSGEEVIQTTTGATAIVVGTVPAVGPMIVRAITGTPSATDVWNGQTTPATAFTPTALPVSGSGGKFYAKVQSVQGVSGLQLVNGLTTTQLATVTANANFVPPLPTWVRTCEFDVLASNGNMNEAFRGLTLDNTTPYFYGTTILNGSSLLGVPQPTIPSDQTTTNPSTMPWGIDGIDVTMAGATDGSAPTPIDIAGHDGGPGDRTGIAALIDAQNISIIAAPGITDQFTQQALIDQCESLKYRFAILDPAPSKSGGTPNIQDIQDQRDLYDTKYAAIYYPRIIVTDPLTDTQLTIPPSGHMAGIYAQTDNTRGVWKAPANVVINGISALEIKLSKGDQEILNPEPNNINALRDFRAQARGLRVYGARCITSLTEWKYINVRRLFIFLEASLDQGTQWAVFEPNDQQLWGRLIQSVSAFLTTIWREGGLMGAKAEDAFFVKCGYDTMSQDDIDNGRLIMVVGVAPVFPAEFVIIRIGQWSGGSSVQEL
jgi:phage tail sheath protein FI